MVIKALEESKGGETFISKIPSFKITDLAQAMLPGCEMPEVGIREGEKLHEIIQLEEKLNELLKRQGYLVNDIKDLKKTKKKLMEGIVAGMNDAEPLRDKKKKNQQRLLLEIKERIETESDELIELPRMIKKANEELLATGAHYCFERLANGDEQLKIVKQEIEELRISLREKTEWKDDLEESMDSAYSLMHGLLGHDVMNLYDKRKGKE